MKNTAGLLSLLFVSLILNAQPTIALQQYASGFTAPVGIYNCGDERLFVVQRGGQIRIIDGNGSVKSRPFLDITLRVRSSGSEQGLLGLAFHPDYKNNGYFFVNYTAQNNGETRISRFEVSVQDADSAVSVSEVILLTVPQPFSNHNAGDLAFGPDGYLYIPLGDGGSGGDPGNRAQNKINRLGKTLRIDVDTIAGFKIPPDNPFVNDTTTLDEIWHIGLRNPWRFSFDRLTGDMWLGDVGQGEREEVNFQPANSTGGENFGWRCYEGNLTYNTSGCGAMSNYTFPVFDYIHINRPGGLGCSVVGGYVYRGCKYPNMFGYYVFADYCSGRFWTIHRDGTNWVSTPKGQLGTSFNISCFGEDRNGELYAGGLSNGIIYKVIDNSAFETLPFIENTGASEFCPGDSTELMTQSGWNSYQWLLNDTSVLDFGLMIYAKVTGDYSLKVTGNNGCVYTTPKISISHLTPPSPVITAEDTAFCSGKSLRLETGIYFSYEWSDGSSDSSIIVQSPGNYVVTVTDSSGCKGSSAAFLVSENPLPQPEISQNGLLCSGNRVELMTTENFQAYAWSTGESNAVIDVFVSGDYFVTVTDENGCEGASPLFTVNDNQAAQPTISSSTNEFCTGDSVSLTANMGFIAYNWSNGDTGNVITVYSGGNYAVSAIDNTNCSGISDTINLVENNLPQPVIIPGNLLTACEGDTVVLSTTTAYASYNWSNGATTPSLIVTSSDTFQLSVEDTKGCTGISDSVVIIFYNNPAQPVITQSGSVLSANQGYSYRWFLNGNILPNDTLQTLEIPCSVCTDGEGTFSVEITDSNGCKSISEALFILWSSIHETSFGEISIQPNPFTASVLIQYELRMESKMTLRLIDLTGKEITLLVHEKQQPGFHQQIINAENLRLNPGFYFIEIGNGSYKKTFRIVKI